VDAVILELDIPEHLVFFTPNHATGFRWYDVTDDTWRCVIFKGNRFVASRYPEKDTDGFLGRADAYLDSPNYPGRP